MSSQYKAAAYKSRERHGPHVAVGFFPPVPRTCGVVIMLAAMAIAIAIYIAVPPARALPSQINVQVVR